jgi:hypothetical protein
MRGRPLGGRPLSGRPLSGYGLGQRRRAGGGSGGGAFDPLSLAIFEAFTTPPTAERKALIDTCVRALVAGGVWDLLDVLDVSAAADDQASLINWISPGTHDATAVDGPSFVADQGYTFASTAYLDSNFNPATAGGNYAQNSCSVFGWTPSTLVDSGGMVGSSSGRDPMSIYAYFGAMTFVNPQGDYDSGGQAAGGSDHFYGFSRTSATDVRVVAGATQHTISNNSAALDNGNIVIGRRAAQAFSGTLSCVAIGGGMSSGQITALKAAIDAYLVGL